MSQNSSILVCKRGDPQIGIVARFSDTWDGRLTGQRDSKATIRVPCIVCITVKRKTITIREDQEEWIADQHLNLSSFVREQLDELIAERE